MSLRWKTGLFLFVLLLAITTGFVLREQAEIERHYRALRHELLSRQVALSEEAIRQSFSRLQTTASAVALHDEMHASLTAPGKKKREEAYDDDWRLLQASMRLTLLAIQDTTGKTIHARQFDGERSPPALNDEEMASLSRATIGRGSPLTHAACREQCQLYAWAPVRDHGRIIGTAMVATALTDSLLSYFQLIQADAGIVMPSAGKHAGDSDDQHYLPDGEAILAMSDSGQARRVMTQLRPTWQDSGSHFMWQAVTVADQHYEVARWPIKAGNNTLPASIITMMNVDQAAAEKRQAFWSSVAGGLSLFLIAVFCALLLTRRVLRRLQGCGEAIELLGQRSYEASRQRLRSFPGKRRSQDEIGKINRITFAVSERLEAMEAASNDHESALTNLVLTLEREKTLVAELLNTAPFHIVVHNEQGHIIMANRFAAELKRSSPPLLLARPFIATFFEPGEANETAGLIRQLLNDGMTRRQESTLLQDSNARYELVWLHCRMRLPDSDDALVLSIGQDVTALKRSEVEREHFRRQLQQAQKMEAIGQLTGGIAHDFNNILASILGYTELALHQSRDQGGKLSRYLSEVQSAGERARDLIAQMLAFSRSGDSERRRMPLEPLIKEVLKLLRPLFPTTMSLRTDISRVPPVLANPAQMQQILMNLAINARDATRQRGNVTIRVAKQHWQNDICASCHSPIVGDFVTLTVSDDGDGIAGEHLPRIFDPFFTTKDIGKGTGMGLSIVHGLTHDFGGHLLVDSTPGTGTTFTVLLPISTDDDYPEQNKQTSLLPIDSFHGCRMLIVDDEGSIAHFLAELMETRGIVVAMETDSSQALARFAATPADFDLVLSDLTMPTMSGIELTTALRDIRADIPIIVWSGCWDDALLSSAGAAGINATLNKPVQIEQLWEAIAKLYASKRHQAAD